MTWRASRPRHLRAVRSREMGRPTRSKGRISMDRHGRPQGRCSSPTPFLWLDLAAAAQDSTNTSSPPGRTTPGEHKAKGATSTPSLDAYALSGRGKGEGLKGRGRATGSPGQDPLMCKSNAPPATLVAQQAGELLPRPCARVSGREHWEGEICCLLVPVCLSLWGSADSQCHGNGWEGADWEGKKRRRMTSGSHVSNTMKGGKTHRFGR